ncbi:MULTISPECIES: hypothetical protein, partial [unclassified Bradyrhizobium]|uniref:hypothetical protein n=1 Tax=unclassified Bradyrhizobium TaxID=2631580 RepID=UPI003398B913
HRQLCCARDQGCLRRDATLQFHGFAVLIGLVSRKQHLWNQRTNNEFAVAVAHELSPSTGFIRIARKSNLRR